MPLTPLDRLNSVLRQLRRTSALAPRWPLHWNRTVSNSEASTDRMPTDAILSISIGRAARLGCCDSHVRQFSVFSSSCCWSWKRTRTAVLIVVSFFCVSTRLMA